MLSPCWHAKAQPALSHSPGPDPVCLIHSPQLLLIEITSFIFHSLSAIPTLFPVLEDHETAEMEARKLGWIEGLGC